MAGEGDLFLQPQGLDGGLHGFRGRPSTVAWAGGDHVQPGAAGDLADLGQSGLLGPGGLEGGLIVALFDVDDGEIRVRGDGVGGVGVGTVIPLHVPEARLLVSAGDEADVVFQRNAQVLHGLHGQQGGHHGAFVVVGAPGRREGRLPLWVQRRR